jgi:excisionase family DNA binding protein
MTTAEVANRLSVAIRTVCLWAEVGELPGLKVGRQWRFERTAIEQWIAARSGTMQKSTSA